MILIIPKIELINGQTNFHVKNLDSDSEMKFCLDPINLLKVLRKENSKTLHLSDFDSLCNKDNSKNIETIRFIENCIDIPLELEANFSDFDTCSDIFKTGIYRLFLSDIFFDNKELLNRLLIKYKNSRISLSFNYNNDTLFSNSSKNKIDLESLLKELSEIGIHRILIKFDDKYEPHILEILDNFDELFLKYGINLTISCDIYDYKKLISLNKYQSKKIDSIIMGKPFYKNSFSCQKIWRLIESELENSN